MAEKSKRGCLKTFLVLVVAAAVLIVVVMIATGGDGSASRSDREAAYQAELNKTFADAESGIKSFRIEGSLIYVEVDSSVDRSDYDLMSRAWARKYSEEGRDGRNVTAFITRDGTAYAKMTWSRAGGFKP